jgi:hypothetical protein
MFYRILPSNYYSITGDIGLEILVFRRYNNSTYNTYRKGANKW